MSFGARSSVKVTQTFRLFFFWKEENNNNNNRIKIKKKNKRGNALLAMFGMNPAALQFNSEGWKKKKKTMPTTHVGTPLTIIGWQTPFQCGMNPPLNKKYEITGKITTNPFSFFLPFFPDSQAPRRKKTETTHTLTVTIHVSEIEVTVHHENNNEWGGSGSSRDKTSSNKSSNNWASETALTQSD